MKIEHLNKISNLNCFKELVVIQEIKNLTKGVIIQKLHNNYYLHVDFILSNNTISGIVDILNKDATISNIKNGDYKISTLDLEQLKVKSPNLSKLFLESLVILKQNGIVVENIDKLEAILSLRNNKVINITAKDLDFSGTHSSFSCFSEFKLIGMQGEKTKLCFFHAYDDHGDIGDFYVYGKDLIDFFSDYEFAFESSIDCKDFKLERKGEYDFMKNSIELTIASMQP